MHYVNRPSKIFSHIYCPKDRLDYVAKNYGLDKAIAFNQSSSCYHNLEGRIKNICQAQAVLKPLFCSLA